jgi:hypothetical protein
MKMVFHFIRVIDSDITVEGATMAECMQKALDARITEVTPRRIVGEVVPE